jgi:signal recognition particle receptor subunit beta
MVFFNYALRKLNAKIVYYGPGLCGKTTNLQWIHDNFEGGQRGKMISLATEGDRTIFFDLLPLDIGSIRGMQVTLQLYTVPGQVHYNSTRQLVLKGADGVVFVADSQRAMMKSNIDSLKNLEENLQLQGIELRNFPFCLQFNKRDLSDLLSIEELDASLNEIYHVPFFEAVATKGIGVQETLEGIVKLVMRNLRQRYEPSRGKRSFASPSAAAAAPEPEPVPEPAPAPEPTPAPAPAPEMPEMPAAAAPAVEQPFSQDFAPPVAEDEPVTAGFGAPGIEDEIDFGSTDDSETSDVGVFDSDLDFGAEAAGPDIGFDAEAAGLDIGFGAAAAGPDIGFGVDEPTGVYGAEAPASVDFSTGAVSDETPELDLSFGDDEAEPELVIDEVEEIEFDDASFDEDDIEVIELPEEIKDAPSVPASPFADVQLEDDAMDLAINAETGPVAPPPGSGVPTAENGDLVIDFDLEPDQADAGELGAPAPEIDSGSFDLVEEVEDFAAEPNSDFGFAGPSDEFSFDDSASDFEVVEADDEFDVVEPDIDFAVEEPAADFEILDDGFEVEPEEPGSVPEEPVSSFGIAEPVSGFGMAGPEVSEPEPEPEISAEEASFFDEVAALDDEIDVEEAEIRPATAEPAPAVAPEAPVELAAEEDELVLDADDEIAGIDDTFDDMIIEEEPVEHALPAEPEIAEPAPAAEPLAAEPVAEPAGPEPFLLDDSDPFGAPQAEAEEPEVVPEPDFAAPEVELAEPEMPQVELAEPEIPEVELPELASAEVDFAAPEPAAAEVDFAEPEAPPTAGEVPEPEPIPEPEQPQPHVIRAEAVPASAVIPAIGMGPDNQLQLRLEGTGAIAESGQVRALDLIVPVPGNWVGNRRVTLQLRLTLEPTEDSDGG